MRKEEVSIQGRSNALVPSELLAIVGCQGVNAGGKGLSKAIMVSDAACAVLNGAWAFIEKRDVRSFVVTRACFWAARTNDQVCLPIAKAPTLSHDP